MINCLKIIIISWYHLRYVALMCALPIMQTILTTESDWTLLHSMSYLLFKLWMSELRWNFRCSILKWRFYLSSSHHIGPSQLLNELKGLHVEHIVWVVTCVAMVYVLRYKPRNIIQIHHNVLWDWKYSTEYSSHSYQIREIFYIMLIPRTTIMDLNNVMLAAHHSYI